VILKIEVDKILAFLTWVVYHILRLCLGLVVHPYRTTREIMRGRWFIPLVFLPTGILVWIFLTGRIAAWVVEVPFALRDVIGILYTSAILSIGLWQGLLLYLAVRFWVGLRR
jgi:hypothetical protein